MNKNGYILDQLDADLVDSMEKYRKAHGMTATRVVEEALKHYLKIQEELDRRSVKYGLELQAQVIFEAVDHGVDELPEKDRASILLY